MKGDQVTLRCAVESDIPRLLDIFDSAFADDAHTQLKIAWSGQASMREGMASALHSWLNQSASVMLVAMDPETDAILGWACWAVMTGKSEDDAPQDHALPGAETSLVDELERITNRDIRTCQREMVSPCAVVHVLVAIAVAREHSGHGVGKALVRWGTERADAESRRCWVHASEAGAQLCAHAGFEQHHELTIDLDRYAPPHIRRQWGSVTFRSMVRQPAPLNTSADDGVVIPDGHDMGA